MLQWQIEALLSDKLWILPKWLQAVYVGWCVDDENSAATMHTDKDYRFARLTICGHFLKEPPEKQHEIIYHEFIHCYISPITNYAKEMLDNVISDNELLSKYLHAELTRREEMAAQDFAFAVAEKVAQFRN